MGECTFFKTLIFEIDNAECECYLIVYKKQTCDIFIGSNNFFQLHSNHIFNLRRRKIWHLRRNGEASRVLIGQMM